MMEMMDDKMRKNKKIIKENEKKNERKRKRK